MNCIINFASGRHVRGQDRLRTSLQETGFDGKFLSWVAESQIGAPLHRENPYAFKIHAFDQAISQGYSNILWVDASVWAIKDVKPIFDHIDKYGYLMQEAGQFVGEWTNDECLNYFGITREEANKMLMYGNAGFLGLSVTSPIAMHFFNNWKVAMRDGIFKGSWDNHRHDMSCGSIIANNLNMTYQSAHDFMNYGDSPKNDTVCLLAKGI